VLSSRAAGRGAVQTSLRFTTAVCTLIAALALPSAAAAFAPPFSLSVTGSRAPYFVLSGQPGETLNSSVSVLNAGNVTDGVTLYAADATTGQTSGAVYGTAHTARTDIGAWINLSAHHLELAPGQTVSVPFQVVIPSHVRPGQHLGGIAAQPDQPGKTFTNHTGKATFHIQVQTISVIAVQVNLPGPLTQRLVITGVHDGAARDRQLLMVGIANTGTALTKGSGSVTVMDGQGRRFHVPFTLDTFVPQTQIEYPLEVTGKALPAGSYSAIVHVASPDLRQTRVIPLTVSQKSLQEAFGSKYTAPPPISGTSLVPIIIAGVALLLVGFTVGALARARRPVGR
jgi:hypothetical protein